MSQSRPRRLHQGSTCQTMLGQLGFLQRRGCQKQNMGGGRWPMTCRVQQHTKGLQTLTMQTWTGPGHWRCCRWPHRRSHVACCWRAPPWPCSFPEAKAPPHCNFARPSRSLRALQAWTKADQVAVGGAEGGWTGSHAVRLCACEPAASAARSQHGRQADQVAVGGPEGGRV